MQLTIRIKYCPNGLQIGTLPANHLVNGLVNGLVNCLNN
ncbi:hypothetical protein C427_4404 [Paraglaciecola psychrophila 170]|uniref:Uncharacterized protein n=1 Tax=Paraglaciecola psychrophila 170 TaxID=1129794 RepID=K7AVF1_9ALTE|nr:hypothetical protein C427_4404 [Paraglaciecola psychrophila 170]GAC39165.1 hypothetical protein GPSY_3554 [Paraglaciecola psychrophila 170]